MTTPLRDALTQRIDQVGPAHPDVDLLVGLGEQRLRRRRLTVVLGGVVGVALAITVGVGIALHGPITRSEAPAHPPPTDSATARQLVYSDSKMGVPGDTVHFGDRVVETGSSHVHMDVTEDGFLYTDNTPRAGVWFSDGSRPVQVGSHGCGGARPLGNFDTGAVMTGTSGSTAAWFECTRPAPTLVVYDSFSRQEVARLPVPFCRAGCGLVDVTSDYVYFASGRSGPDYRFDWRADRLRATRPGEYADDLRSQPRGLILGDDWQSGTPTSGDGHPLAGGSSLSFVALHGSRLVPVVWWNSDRQQVTSAFDTATRRVLRLRLPAGYHGEKTPAFDLFEWLDDDTVALFGGSGEILTCHLSTGRCAVAVRAGEAGTWRIVPSRPLPG